MFPLVVNKTSVVKIDVVEFGEEALTPNGGVLQIDSQQVEKTEEDTCVAGQLNRVRYPNLGEGGHQLHS